MYVLGGGGGGGGYMLSKSQKWLRSWQSLAPILSFVLAFPVIIISTRTFKGSLESIQGMLLEKLKAKIENKKNIFNIAPGGTDEVLYL